jgi:hydroxyacylglutathione hydrolase
MRVVPVPCLSDNYAYLVVTGPGGPVAIVDPSEPGPVVRALEALDLRPTAIWNTHHHFDHTGGNEELAKRYGIEWVSGHASDRGRIPRQTKFLEAGETFDFGGATVKILHIPGHTLGAVAYVVRAPGDVDATLFTGDTMFHAGCGRLFEGTPAQMTASLASLVAEGDGARVYPGHEYTVQNLRFARSVEPGNRDVDAALAHAEELRGRGEATVGTNIALERATNPFLRTSSRQIRETLGIDAAADDASALAKVREAKNSFK